MAKSGARAAAGGGQHRFLPAGLREFLVRRTRDAGALAWAALALAVLLMLASYHPADPSWNTAADGPTRNLLGGFGAYPADLLIQTLGLGVFMLPVVFGVWAWQMLWGGGGPRPWLRALALPLALLATSLGLAPMASPVDWTSPVGLGGAVGDLLATALAETLLLRFGMGEPAWASPLALALAGFLWLVAIGLSFAQWRYIALMLAHLVATAGRLAWRLLQRLVPLLAAVGQRADGLVRRLMRGQSGRDPGRGRAPTAAPRLRLPVHLLAPAAAWAERLAERLAARLGLAPARVSVTPGAAYRPPPVMRGEPPRVVDPQPAMPPAAGIAPVARAGSVVAPRTQPLPEGRRAGEARQPRLDFDEPTAYQLPPVDLLDAPDPKNAVPRPDDAALAANAELLEGVLGDFGVRGQIVRINPGPVVTLYELEPAPGIKSSRVISLADDIARSMSAVSARVAVVPGRNAIGIELPNSRRETVYLRELLASQAYEKNAGRLSLVLGKDIGGQPVITDLARMPHLLVAGTTGSGKSVSINTMILSLLYRLPPDRVRFIMVDPKMLELSVYDGIPHLLTPVVTDPKQAVVALKWTVREMENRYRAMAKLGVRNIDGFNQRLALAREQGEVLTRRVQIGFDPDTGKPLFEEQPMDLTELPYIVVVVDEMADLMLVAGKDIEAAIQRLAQMARAAGIHLIMATQRPSVDVITGTIKANFPTRISFQVTSKIDSRTILGEQGAEQLLGLGDMLFMPGSGRLARVHGCFASDRDVETVVRYLKTQGEPDYNDQVLEEDEETGAFSGDEGIAGSSGDDLYDRAVALVARERKASTSFIQRHLQIGYNRAARLIERMEAEGVVGRANHVGKREVLVRSTDDWDE